MSETPVQTRRGPREGTFSIAQSFSAVFVAPDAADLFAAGFLPAGFFVLPTEARADAFVAVFRAAAFRAVVFRADDREALVVPAAGFAADFFAAGFFDAAGFFVAGVFFWAGFLAGFSSAGSDGVETGETDGLAADGFFIAARRPLGSGA